MPSKRVRNTDFTTVTFSGHMAHEASLHPISEKYMWNDCGLYPASINTSRNLRKDLLDEGVEESTVIVHKRLLEVGRKAMSLKKTINDSKKVIFSDETHLSEERYKSSAVSRSEGETPLPDHFQ
ncbi:hypothetical protein TNCV_4687651 [Trichonephila clavipes]|nr:hypothetical protein TNCV_4687651 [Trichonephila clavipes]